MKPSENVEHQEHQMKNWKRAEPQIYFISAAIGGWMMIGFIGEKLTILCWVLPLIVLGYYRGSRG